jgi:hypothetical protein
MAFADWARVNSMLDEKEFGCNVSSQIQRTFCTGGLHRGSDTTEGRLPKLGFVENHLSSSGVYINLHWLLYPMDLSDNPSNAVFASNMLFRLRQVPVFAKGQKCAEPDP